MARKPSAPPSPILMVVQTEIGMANTVRGAFEQIGLHWDGLPYGTDTFSGHYEFEIDEHHFTVHVTPISALPQIETPFDEAS
jgi:hypothetical protein